MRDQFERQKRCVTVPMVLIVLTVMLLAAACSARDDTAAIRKLIDEGARLAEAQQLSDLMDLTTDDFSAQPGDYDARHVKGVLFIAFRHYGKFEVRYPNPTVTLAEDGTTAQTALYFMIVSKDKEIPGLKELYDNPRQWLEEAGEIADLYELKLDLLQTSGKWLVRRAALEGFKGYGF